jgi:hypothetical protein
MLTDGGARRTPRESDDHGGSTQAISPEHRFNEQLSTLATEVLAGRCQEMPWELFRVSHLPGWTHDEAAAEVGRWAAHYGIKVTFEDRTIRNQPVIFVCFGC